MKRAILVFALLCGAVSAYGNPVTMTLVSFEGQFVNDIPTYPYTLQFAAIVRLIGMCDDYYHGGAPGDYWQAYLTNLENDALSHVRFASAGLDAYQEAAWILIETNTADPSQWPDMNFAVWHIFNPTVQITPQAQYWIDQAVLYHSQVDYSAVYIATPLTIDAPPSGDQEFLFLWHGDHNLPAIPEPSTLALLATGTLGMFTAARRK